MNDRYDENNNGFDVSGKLSGVTSFFGGLPPYLKAALIFAVPFIIVDFFNYYSAGTALALSFPILALLYVGCGALGCKFAAASGSTAFVTGVITGAVLWLISTVINTIIGLILGTLSFGVTLLLGVPYLCLCAPLQLIGGALAGGVGGLGYGLIAGRSSSSNESDPYQ